MTSKSKGEIQGSFDSALRAFAQDDDGGGLKAGDVVTAVYEGDFAGDAAGEIAG
jgi:hypothetical protein